MIKDWVDLFEKFDNLSEEYGINGVTPQLEVKYKVVFKEGDKIYRIDRRQDYLVRKLMAQLCFQETGTYFIMQEKVIFDGKIAVITEQPKIDVLTEMPQISVSELAKVKTLTDKAEQNGIGMSELSVSYALLHYYPDEYERLIKFIRDFKVIGMHPANLGLNDGKMVCFDYIVNAAALDQNRIVVNEKEYSLNE